MAELVTVPISFFEVTFDYARPNLALWGDKAPIVQALFDALEPWDPKVDDIESLNTGKLSEQGIVMKLPLKRVTLFFGPAYCRFSRDAVDWNLAAETIEIFDVATSAFVSLSGVPMGAKKTAIGLHLQPKSVPFLEVLSPFMPPRLGTLENAPLRTMAIVAKWDKRRVTLDGSGSIANGLFVKFEREFESSTTSQEMAAQLLKDEEDLLAMLGVQEDR
jgi:hypothetical protein